MSDRVRPPHDPIRRCVVCRESAPKSSLVRVVRLPNGEAVLSQDADGRGAYIHRRATCLRAAASEPKRLGRSLRREPPPDLLEALPAIAHDIA